MAAKNSVKIYKENSFYHIYNRGVDKRVIFTDEQDFSTFLSYIKTYLLPKEEFKLRAIIESSATNSIEKDKALKLLRLKNFFEDIELHGYALLPNHYHLLVKQSQNVLHSFMNALGTRYSMYFNKKHKRTGVLFQDVYKAVLVESDEQLLQLSRYIHLNPIRWLNLSPKKWREVPFPTSLHEYLRLRSTAWIKTNDVLSYFSKSKQTADYEDFLGFEQNFKVLEDIAIDLETD